MKLSSRLWQLKCLNKGNDLIQISLVYVGYFNNFGIWRSKILLGPIIPLLTASSIWVPTAMRALKLEKYYANRYLWYTCNRFFTTIVNCSSSLGRLIICAALAFHLVMKVEKDSLGSCLEVSRSLQAISTSVLYLYYLWNSLKMSSQVRVHVSSKIKNHLEGCPNQDVLEHLSQLFLCSS